jgi:hypothetical protein
MHFVYAVPGEVRGFVHWCCRGGPGGGLRFGSAKGELRHTTRSCHACHGCLEAARSAAVGEELRVCAAGRVAACIPLPARPARGAARAALAPSTGLGLGRAPPFPFLCTSSSPERPSDGLAAQLACLRASSRRAGREEALLPGRPHAATRRCKGNGVHLNPSSAQRASTSVESRSASW